MSPQLLAYLAGGGAVLAAVTLVWLLSVRLRDAGIVDVFWSLGFVLAAWIYRGFGPPATWRFFEAVGDYQLARFKSRPENRGKVLNRGLWATTRHPNYFGDATLWWGFFCFALASPLGLRTLPSALLMSFLLRKVSGVALLEKTIADRRPDYRDYVESVPAFVPWRLLGLRRGGIHSSTSNE
jgi:steroid 5-alpha reductase family enzyme